MRTVRILIYGLPAVLLLLFAASLLSVRFAPPKPKNNLIVGSIGEPKLLNPIQAADASASSVMDLVFEGLLTFDENLEVIGRLAESWNLLQTSTMFFTNEGRAHEAEQKLAGMKGQWKEWGLLNAEATGDELRLYLQEPGAKRSREIRQALSGIATEKVHAVRVNLKSSARESFGHFKQQSKFASRLKRVWYDYNSAFETSFVDPDGELMKEIGAYYAANKDLQPKVEELASVEYLDEPELNFRLRKDVRWHDGQPFTAKDVEFTYRKIMDETIISPRKPDYDLVQSVEIPSLQDVRVVYRRPYSPALNSWMIGILPEHILGDKDSNWWAANFNRVPIGTGPFKFKVWKTNEVIELEKNPDYFRGAPHLDEIIFRTIPDPTSIRVAFETKQIDFWSVDPHAVGKFSSAPRFDFYSSPGSGYTYVGWNLRRPMFQDLRVRRALAHAVDVDAIIKYVMYGYGQRSDGMWDPRMWWHSDDVTALEYDPDKAKTILAEAGWKPGPSGILQKNGQKFSFTLITNNGNEIRRDVATLVQASLRKIGIEVEVQIYEWAVFLSQFIDKGDFDACVLGWSLGPDYDQYQIWHSSQTGPGMLNFVAYKNPKVDSLLDQIRSEFDHDEIKRLASEIQQTVYADQPYLFLFVPSGTDVTWKNSLRVRRPGPMAWVDEPLRMTKAGLGFYREYFYRPEYAPSLTP